MAKNVPTDPRTNRFLLPAESDFRLFALWDPRRVIPRKRRSCSSNPKYEVIYLKTMESKTVGIDNWSKGHLP